MIESILRGFERCQEKEKAGRSIPKWDWRGFLGGLNSLSGCVNSVNPFLLKEKQEKEKEKEKKKKKKSRFSACVERCDAIDDGTLPLP